MSKKKSVKKMTVSKGVEKKNLDEFDVTDGKERGIEEIKEEKELDDLLGGPQLNPYGTLSKDVFEERLNSSSASELKDLAARVGVPKERNSTLLKKLNNGEYDEVPTQIKRWTKANGKELEGLIKRREAEALLFEGKSWQ
jgi:lysozyme